MADTTADFEPSELVLDFSGEVPPNDDEVGEPSNTPPSGLSGKRNMSDSFIAASNDKPIMKEEELDAVRKPGEVAKSRKCEPKPQSEKP
mmetsp:Transcript_21465/g.40221  ORF Transcript_21465/g.40221 Transcript_21465/m.40221 type:complete len:89 (+) Transcript_21465:212-478(+)